MPKLKGAELITEYLIASDIPYVFGICGHGNVGMLDPLYEATVDVVEEAVLNAICAGVPMTGHDGHSAPALPRRRGCPRYNPRFVRYRVPPCSSPSPNACPAPCSACAAAAG